MKNKKFLIIALVILAVGFAAVSTSLYISGKTLIGINSDDFEVYFSSAVLDDVDESNEFITNNKKEIDFTTTLTTLNETSELEFEITNASTQYDADVSISCILSSTDYLSFTTDKSLYEVKAQTRETGLLTIKLDKVSTEELNQTISCTLVATAKELDKAADVVLTDTTYQITGTGEPNTTYVVYSDTPHIVTTDDYGFFYVSGLEKGSHEIYYLGEINEDLTSKTKDEIKLMAVDKANITTSSTSINFKTNEFENFVIKPEEQEEVTIDLDANGGTVSDASINLDKYVKGSELPNPTPKSSIYTFLGWYNGDKKITDNTIINDNMNVEAKWEMNCPYTAGQTWTYNYSGSSLHYGNEQTYQVVCPGTYKLEVWGAQGGRAAGGKGGYSSGTISLDVNTTLYINVGGQGSDGSDASLSNYEKGGYNGGGASCDQGGGGATHIATKSGELYTLENYKDTVLIVAGGGGASDSGSPGGAGGGTTGGNGYLNSTVYGKGGTQTAGGAGYKNGSFGKGGDSYVTTGTCNGAGAGGGGWYGGGSSTNSGDYGGGGGSGYIGGVSNGTTTSGQQSGAGKAVITLVSID